MPPLLENTEHVPRLSKTLEVSDWTRAGMKVGQISRRLSKTEHFSMQSSKFCPQYFVVLHCVLSCSYRSELILQPKYKPAPPQRLDFLLNVCMPN